MRGKRPPTHVRVKLVARRSLAQLAAEATPIPVVDSIKDDAMPARGSQVSISPDGYTTDAVSGTLARIGSLDVAIRRKDASLGDVMVHFPRIGYTMSIRSPCERR